MQLGAPEYIAGGYRANGVTKCVPWVMRNRRTRSRPHVRGRDLLHASRVSLLDVFDVENNAQNWLTKNDIKGQHTYGVPVSVSAWMHCGSLEANCQHYVGRLTIMTSRARGLWCVDGGTRRLYACSWSIDRSYGAFRDGRLRLSVLNFLLYGLSE